MGGTTQSKNVLVGIDGSKNSEKAFHWLLSHMPKEKVDRIILFHNMTPPSDFNMIEDGELDFSMCDYEDNIQKIRDEAKNLEDKFMNECSRNSVSCQWINQWGKPTSTILRAIDKFHANMVVLGSCGLNPLMHTILGSVSSYVLHHSHVPVLIVPLSSSINSKVNSA